MILKMTRMMMIMEYVKAASSQVQREIKVTFEDVFQYVINCWLKDGSKFGAINNKYLLLGLSQLSFFHEPTDLQLFINSGILRCLGNLLSSQQAQLVAANDDEKNKYVLNERVVLSCSQLLQLIAVRTGERLDVLKSTTEVIQFLLAALYHQLNILSHSSQLEEETAAARDKRLVELLGFMLFLKMLFSNFPGLMEFADIKKWFMHFKSIATSSCQDTLSKVTKKTIILSIQLLGELLVTKSNRLSVEVEAQGVSATTRREHSFHECHTEGHHN
ncbi:probable E3 ubiquitin-protein ligase HERC1 isoform X2 [Dysidea avara]|uniref:probable E3 ubiquitin-protein ligase HERC1 isoform X2 n=1 Tax=Dysidea avara TaxID=196820 RepID=UPI003326211C